MSVLAIAHRAGNSLGGLHAANLLGADVIECDVHAHRGRLEVRHTKTAGPLPFLWDRWELRSAWAPRLGLAELLSADRGGTTFMLDLKGRRARTGLAVAAQLHELGHGLGPERPILACGRYWPAVDEVARLPYVRPVLSARTGVELRALHRRVRLRAPYGVSVHLSLLDPSVVASLREHVEVVMTWPINDAATLARALDVGANGIITDEPDVLAAVAGRRSG
ncbi:hypothetical protein GGQ22_06055 [Nocardioides sp. zg-579]|uniref:Uncharacterized protein n=1 Tax=Nocardioides marmotae TaxID=2663857 RepID=A0A6I3J9M0_9ACTN|nr:glycerophosphodiester phosphodiesterase [Nocardioides marmotae]MCR6031003.1 hypothetical protein [Gordonia jinghuaiqii]MTB94640.1 hypothetical protein [Nocardioides marmotae]QKE01352.1 glycerophosphodiester phosphodiesterase [Nocardioides marmotae]